MDAVHTAPAEAGANRRLLFLDFETYSSVDLKACGSFRYMESPDFEILLLAHAFNDAPVQVTDIATGEPWSADFLNAVWDPQVIKIAHNAAFERYAIWKALGRYCPPEEWFDTMILAGQCGLPMSLEEAGAALQFSEDQAKLKEGKALIRYFCQPCKPTKTNGERRRNLPGDAPEKWQRFKDYCGRDVETERTLFHTLRRWAPGETEHRFWCLDARINERGMKIDTQIAVNAVAMDNRYKDELTKQAVALTGISNPKSVSQIKKWLKDQEGQEFPSLNKKVIADVVAQLQTEDARRFMDIRAELSKSSTAKYEAMLRSVCPDDHVRGCFQFYGANRTGRFSGRLVQLQNLPQNHLPDLAEARELVRGGRYSTLKALYDGVSKPLSELIRTALIPEEGCKIMVADFSAIEARVIAWFADEQWRLDVFREGGDIYCASASQMFHVPVVKHGVNGELRQKGKIAELALGYGGGVNALKAFGADKMGMTESEMQETVDLWRESSPRIVALWKAMEKAAIRCTVRRTGTTSTVGNVRFDYEDGILWMRLPSGRRIAYFGAQYGPSRWRPDRQVLSYMGVDQQSKKWCRVETWGGKLTENCWAGNTPVLTERGWLPISDIHSDTRVWDGEEWVPHAGSEGRFCAEVLYELDGLLVTGDHRILTTEGWSYAKECDGLDRVCVQLPEGFASVGEKRPARETSLGSTVPMRRDQGYRYSGSAEAGESGQAHVLRVQKEGADIPREHDAWDDRTPRIRRLAVHDTAMHEPEAQGLAELWRTWNNGMRGVVTQLRELLGRHGTHLRSWSGFGPKRQRHGLLPGKLSLGHENSELSKQARRENSNTERVRNPAEGAVGASRREVHDPSVQAGPRLACRATDRKSGPDFPVYDLINCGPRHRYVVLGESGPIIAHNCVQATARDCLRDAMLALEAEGYDIRAHVHDEVIVSEPVGGRCVEDMAAIMGRPLPWAPGLPLRADGYETPFYKKD